MIRKSSPLVGGSIRAELDRLWQAVVERTPLPHGSQVVNRTTKGFSIAPKSGGGGTSTSTSTTTTTTTTAKKSTIDSVSYDATGGVIHLNLVDGTSCDPCDNLKTAVAGASIRPAFGVGDTIYYVTGAGFAVDLNVDARTWVTPAEGCKWNATTGQYDTTDHFTNASHLNIPAP